MIEMSSRWAVLSSGLAVVTLLSERFLYPDTELFFLGVGFVVVGIWLGYDGLATATDGDAD